MNETDFLRQQLAAERARLREVLAVVRAQDGALTPARPIARYIDWARHRLVQQLLAQRTALQSAGAVAAEDQAQLAAVAAALKHVTEATTTQPLPQQAQLLLALLDAWGEPLEALAARTLRIGHWRQAAHLSADTILEERQLYAAARGAVGLP